MRPAILLLVLAGGCGSVCSGTCEVSDEASPWQGHALAVASEVYGWPGPWPPVTWVVTGDCAGGQRFTNPSGRCVWGYLEPDGARAWIMRGDWYSFAHEMLHVALRGLRGDYDGEHARPEWGTWLPDAYRRAVSK